MISSNASTSRRLGPALGALFAVSALAGPVTYKIDPGHTFPSFEADHMGISVWRGKLTRSAGQVTFDKVTGAGGVDIAVELGSIDFGNDALNGWARGPDFFNAKERPQATYKGRFEGAVNGTPPTRLVGDLTLNGITKPMALTIHSLKCVPHPLVKRELCGADAAGTFNRDDFGLSAGKDYGFRMDVTLRIQVEALASE